MAPFHKILLDREDFYPLVVHCILVGLQLLLLPLHTPGSSYQALSEPLFLKVVFEDYVVLGSEALIVIAYLNRDDRLLISIRKSFFSISPFRQNSKVKHA